MGDLRKKLKKKQARHQRARWRVRSRLDGTAERPRLACHKSLRYIYVQAIDDVNGATLAQASSMEKSLQEKLDGKTCNAAAARLVGETVAGRLKEKGVTSVVFDRGGFIYHGKVKALAEGARAGGLEF